MAAGKLSAEISVSEYKRIMASEDTVRIGFTKIYVLALEKK
jgi:hypothetical protein